MVARIVDVKRILETRVKMQLTLRWIVGGRASYSSRVIVIDGKLLIDGDDPSEETRKYLEASSMGLLLLCQ